MSFHMICPKCEGKTFSIERDNRTYAPRGQIYELVFSCRCGKQLFGDQVIKEFERQKKTYDAAPPKKAAVKRAVAVAPKVRPKAHAAKPTETSVPATSPTEASEPATPQGEQLPSPRASGSPAEQGAAPNVAKDHDTTTDDDGCAWLDCANPPRPNSKYCSRDCSNKFARWRYKQRKSTGQEAA